MPCSSDGYCKALDERIHPEANAAVSGFSSVEVTNLQTGDHKVMGVVYRRNRRDRGLMLNFCPFCGGSIDQGFREPSIGRLGLPDDGRVSLDEIPTPTT